MASLIEGYEYDIFVTYRQKDNKYDGWVTDFVTNLKKELDATFKEEVSVYFDANPHDGLLESHDVDKTVHSKINCLVLIPIISQTYCDPASFAWKAELVPFVERASHDRFGLTITLPSGNVARRIIPVKIHEIESQDVQLLSQALKGELRSIDFTYQSPGVNRPLRNKDDDNKTSASQLMYRDQINKVANAIKELIYSMKRQADGVALKNTSSPNTTRMIPEEKSASFLEVIRQRRILQVGFIYATVALLIFQAGLSLGPNFGVPNNWLARIGWLLVLLGPVAIVLAWFFEFGPQGIARIGTAKSESNSYDPSRRKPFTGMTIIVILLGLLIAQTIYFRSDSLLGRHSPMPSTIESNSIAVLPFKNMSSEIDNEYFSDGLTEDIIIQLSRISSLRVISRASVIGYKDRKESLREIANALGVAKILEGSVQRSGNNIRIRVQLVDVFSDNHLWAENFDRELGDVFVLQSEMAKSIAQAMKATLSEAEKTQLDKKPTSNITAYDYYLRGREFYNKYEAQSNGKAIEEFRKAIALDPSFALAWSGLGDAYSQVHGRFGGDVSWIDSSLVAGRRAVALDSNLSEGYKALANAYNYAKEYDLGFSLLQKAVSLNPNNAQAVGNLGTGYFFKNQLNQALKWEKKAAGLNPRSFIPFQIVGWIYRLLGDYENAEQWLKRSLELKPFRDTYEQLALCYVAKGEKNKAKELIPNLLELGDDYKILETAGLIAFLGGDFEMAKEYFRKSIDQNKSIGSDVNAIGPIYLGYILLEEKNQVDSEIFLANAFDLNLEKMKNGSQDDEHAFYLAGICATQGKTKEAIDWLRVAKARNWIDYAMAANNPLFTNLKEHPDFIAIIDSLKKQTMQMRE